MEQPREKLGRRVRVKASILKAHLSWAAKRWPDFVTQLKPHLDAETLALVERPPQGDKAMVLFSQLVRVDRALAAAGGGDPEAIFEALGVHSAQHNLQGVYQSYDPEAPHDFFTSMTLVHRALQDFGTSIYERLGERSGRVRITRYREYSTVFCQGGRGYYAEALRMMKVPGPVVVREVACHCTGDPACVFEMAW